MHFRSQGTSWHNLHSAKFVPCVMRSHTDKAVRFQAASTCQSVKFDCWCYLGAFKCKKTPTNVGYSQSIQKAWKVWLNRILLANWRCWGCTSLLIDEWLTSVLTNTCMSYRLLLTLQIPFIWFGIHQAHFGSNCHVYSCMLGKYSWFYNT